MTNNQDARPFVDLKKDAEEFRIKFDEDIKECLNFLDDKISTLICDPDSYGAQRRIVHQNTLAEFSKAKYDIFISMKSLINAKEREWLDYIAEMKKFFIDNVEIFLAGTKLEVKLPPSESVSSHGFKKSQDNDKSNSTSVIRSIYPILDTITKKLPVGVTTQFNRRGRLSTSSIKLANTPYEEEMDINEVELDRSELRSSFGKKSGKLSNSGIAQNSSTDENEVQEIETNKYELPVKGRKGKSAPKMKDLSVVAKNSSSSDENEVQEMVETNKNEQPAKGRRGRTVAKVKNLSVAAVNNINTVENEGRGIETNRNELPSKGRRGRSAPKTNDVSVVDQNGSSTDENTVQKIETNKNGLPVKGRRGKSASKAKDLSVVRNTINIDEDEGQEIETNAIEPPIKGRRGRQTTKDLSDQNVVKKTSVKGRRAVKPQIEEKAYKPGPSQLSKTVSFDDDDSSSDELSMQTPLARPAKSAARRKTLLPNLEDILDAEAISRNTSRAKAKRKTISGVAELEKTLAPPKRLKVSLKDISSQEEDSSANDNLLESDDNYSDWMALRSVDGKIPTQSAVYELKVWRAKKPAYIGSCESLRQKLTLYKLKQTSGHKHLDKFIERNYDDIQVRFEVVSSFNFAKEEVKDRIKNFVTQYKTTPAYN